MYERCLNGEMPDYSSMASIEFCEALGDEITELATEIDAVTYQFLLLVEEFDREHGWRDGFQSCAHWLNYRCGTALGAAREIVSVARALTALPNIACAFESADISYATVCSLAVETQADRDDATLQMSGHDTAVQLERLIVRTRGAKWQDEDWLGNVIPGATVARGTSWRQATSHAA